jgi:uncharacterized protein (TIGR00730 family)
MSRLCIFCGSAPGRRPAYAAAARLLGTTLATRGIGLVYGGGNVGLMGTLADAALDAGGEVIGVMPRALVDRERAHRRLSSLRVVESMHERKQLMNDLADGFVALPGGFGTLDELFEVLTWAQLGMHQKPCALYDVDGFWEPLWRMVEQQVAEDFVHPHHQKLLLRAADPDQLLAQLASFVATEPLK